MTQYLPYIKEKFEYDEYYPLVSGQEEITVPGRREIARYLYNLPDLEGQPGQFSVFEMDKIDWSVGKGKPRITKQISSYIWKMYGAKLSNETITALGNLANEYLVKPSSYKIRFTDNLNGKAEDYYHSTSCWWGSYSRSRDYLVQNGGGAILWYKDVGGEDVLCGRVFHSPYEGHMLLFNSYDHTGTLTFSIMAQLLADFFAASSLQIWWKPDDEPTDSKYYPHLYINTGRNYLIHADPAVYSERGMSLKSHWKDSRDIWGVVCQECGRMHHEEDTVSTPEGRVCDDCYGRLYFNCQVCSNTHRREEAREAIFTEQTFRGDYRHTTRTVCASCAERRCSVCSDNGNLYYSAAGYQVDGQFVSIEAIEAGQYYQCEQCGERHRGTGERIEEVHPRRGTLSKVVCGMCASRYHRNCEKCGSGTYSSLRYNGSILCRTCLEDAQQEEPDEYSFVLRHNDPLQYQSGLFDLGAYRTLAEERDIELRRRYEEMHRNQRALRFFRPERPEPQEYIGHFHPVHEEEEEMLLHPMREIQIEWSRDRALADLGQPMEDEYFDPDEEDEEDG